eukprot:TRINITY_DN1553_c1_g1_i2.p1 TRINITY_DN1553_c1_g1~~TRINITY_DN1553_c1_g1_i2.p1  ORF type:complete len:599 (-),score=156.69 TRINITY_DN1553_c1_g1_i2:18-1676(-)
MNAPVLVLNTNTKRETGRKAQTGNIVASKAVSDLIRTCLGPRAMLKMVLDAMGGIVLTNDGNAILREIDVAHPAAKSMIEISRSQDENVGDGTTSVIILAGEVLQMAEPWLEKGIHPQEIIGGFSKALDDAIDLINKMAKQVDINNRKEMLNIIATCIGTKFSSRWSDLMCGLALDAVQTVLMDDNGRKEIDIKRYAKVEKVPGGEMTDCKVLKGVMLNKDVTHSKMRRRIENPRILLLDCPLEYKKAESQMNIEVKDASHWDAILKQEEAYIAKQCADIIALKPDIVFTEKGLSDLTQHYFIKANITAFRRVRKTDNLRIARACGATIAHRTDELQESDIGTGCGLFEVRKIGDDYFCFIEECKEPKACTILLRGANKDVLNEIERNLQDAMSVTRNVMLEPRLVPGGGAIEMALSVALINKSNLIEGVQQWTYRGIAQALEVIPRTLAQNCGAKIVKVLTELRAKHASDPEKNVAWGIDGIKGVIADMNQTGIWDPVTVKTQTIKAAVEQACLLLRVDDILSGIATKGAGGGQGPSQQQQMMEPGDEAPE